MIRDGSNLYVATDNGTVDIFDLNSKRRFVNIVFPKIEDFTGEKIAAKIFSIDKIPGNDTLLMVCQGMSGFRDVFIYYDQLIKVIDATSQKMMIREARFVKPDLILMGLTSDELLLFDVTAKKILYRIQIGHYTFDDLVLTSDRSKVLTSDESGIIHMFLTDDGTLLKKYEGQNVDNVFKIDIKDDVLICGGQDRRVAVYDIISSDAYHIQGDFPVYCVALSPSGGYGAYSSNEDSDIVVFDIDTRDVLFTLTGQESTVNNILFCSDNKLIVSCESEKIYFWNLKINK